MSRIILAAALTFGFLAGAATLRGENSSQVDPRYQHAPPAAVERWRDLKYGLRISWGVYAMQGTEASWPYREMPDRQKQEYQELYKRFDPREFDAEKWIESFRRWGVTNFMIITKHCDGFSMFDTKTRVRSRVNYLAPGGPQLEPCDLAYSVMESPIHRDLIKEICDAAHRDRLAIDLYFSHMDWYDADFRMDAYHPFHTFYGQKYDNLNYPEEYHRAMLRHREQIRELLTNYGKIDMMCLDMWLPRWCWPELKETVMMARRLQPDLMIRNRGVGAYGDYHTPENWVPDSTRSRESELPWMVIYTLSGQFAYDPDGAKYKPGSWILENLVDICAKGGNFQVALGPDPQGNFHPQAIRNLEYVGDWLKVNGEAIYKTRPYKYFKEGDLVRYTRSKDDKFIYAMSLKWPGERLTLKLVRPRAGSTITMPGVALRLHWQLGWDGLTIDLPAATLQEESRRPCKQIYVLKIERGEDVPELESGEIVSTASAPAVVESCQRRFPAGEHGVFLSPALPNSSSTIQRRWC